MARGLFRAPTSGAGGGRGMPGMSGTATAFPSAKESERPLPAEIGGYRIVREIGHGGMGVVYEAEQPNTRQRVALKIILPGRASAEGRRRFEREAQALGRLQHAGIPRVFAAGSTGAGDAAQPYMVMEYVEGRSLRDYMRSTNPTAAQRLALCQRIAEALHHAHQKGVIHRDIKPENLVVNAAGQPIVLDFGLARMADDVPSATDPTTRAGQALGTWVYMAPEQADCRPDEVDTRSDVYSLGVVAYELLSGQLPYDLRNKTLAEVLRAIIHDDPIPLSRASSSAGLSAAALRGDAEIIVQKALEKDPGRRFQSADALAAEIRRHLVGEPLTIGRPSTLYRVGEFLRRYRGAVIATGAVFAALVIGLGAALWQANEARAAAQETRRALAASQVQTLRLALQRGRWAEVLSLTDGLVLSAASSGEGVVDPIQLTLARIEALDALDRSGEALTEARRLCEPSVASAHLAAAQLWLGELCLLSPDTRDEGLGLIRTAAGGDLPPADRAYAEAFLARTMPEAAKRLETAVSADATHRRALGMLGVVYSSSGRLDDAIATLTAMSMAFPDDPTCGLLLAVAQSLRGDSVGAARSIDRAVAQQPSGQGEHLRAIFEATRSVVDLAQRHFAGEPIAPHEPVALSIHLAPLLANSMAARGEADPFAQLRRRLLPAASDSWGRVASVASQAFMRGLWSPGELLSAEMAE